jgi:hypothetical protein
MHPALRSQVVVRLVAWLAFPQRLRSPDLPERDWKSTLAFVCTL